MFDLVSPHENNITPYKDLRRTDQNILLYYVPKF